MAELPERMMHTLRLGGLAKRWQEIEYRDDKGKYLHDLLAPELSIRDVNRINRLVKSCGFRVLKTLEDFEWTKSMQLPQGVSQEDPEKFSFLEKRENLILLGR